MMADTGYITQAMRTNSDTVGTYDVHPDLIHGALGLADELIELRAALDNCDRVNALEELSDLCWFTALIANRIDCDPFDGLDAPDPDNEEKPIDNIEYFIGEVVSTVKRTYAYGCDLYEILLIDQLNCLADAISAMCHKLNSTLTEVLDLNISKLAKRYPEKFTPELANNRDTEAERETLERLTNTSKSV